MKRTDKRVTRSLILETNSPHNRKLVLTVEINVVHDTIIHPSEQKFIKIFADESSVKETFYIISYSRKDFEITGINENNIKDRDKFNIIYEKIDNYSELLRSDSPVPAGRLRETLNLDKIASVWKISMEIKYMSIKDDFKERDQSRYGFTVKSNDQQFSGQNITLTVTIRNHITAYPPSVNIHLETASNKDSTPKDHYVGKFHLASEAGEIFRIRNIHSDIKELSFKYDVDTVSQRHTIEFILQYSERYSIQSSSIIVELDYPKQRTVTIPVYLLKKR